MNIGKGYNWKHSPNDLLIYLGKKGSWHQFSRIGDPREVWCEVLDEQLYLIEETKTQQQEQINKKQHYAERDIMALDEAGGYYIRHVSAMTGEKLHSKSDIAAELAYRDMLIDNMLAALEECNEAMAYMSEYDIPLCLPDRVKAAIAKAKGEATPTHKTSSTCGGCGNSDPDKRCLGCLHPF